MRMRNWLIINYQFATTTSYTRYITNMADACEETSYDCSDSISGNNSSLNTECSSSEEKLQYEEIRASSSSAEKQK